MVFACVLHLLGATYATVKKSRGEVLLFKDRKVASAEAPDPTTSQVHLHGKETNEKGKMTGNHGKVALCWNKVTFDVKTGKAYKRLLNEIYGWIEHGTLTALMVSGFLHSLALPLYKGQNQQLNCDRVNPEQAKLPS